MATDNPAGGPLAPAQASPAPWYVPPALGAEVATAALRRGALVCGATLLLAGCGSEPAQDENEPEGEFPVRLDEASFPEKQTLAKDSRLTIEVRNVGDRTIPNINVTVHGFDRTLRDPEDPTKIDPEQANPTRPVFVVDQSPLEFLPSAEPGSQSLVDREVDPPAGSDRSGSVYVDTYSLGELPPDERAVFRWDVSAVHAGPFKLSYEVNAGLDGKAQAVSEGGEPLTGSFEGVIADKPPETKVSAADGKTIITEGGRRIEPQRGVRGRDY